MANDSYSETSSTGWFSRIGGSITGMLMGPVLALAAICLIWWNEGRSVKTAKGLTEGAQITVEARPESLDAALEGKLIHLTGKTTLTGPAQDPMFGVSGDGLIKLRRQVEHYQWVEDKKTTTRTRTGGSEETTTEYTYTRKWDDKVHHSRDFKQPAGHQNPEPSVEKAAFTAASVQLGAYRLPESLLDRWHDFKPYPLPSQQSLPEALREKSAVQGDWLVLSKTPKEPVVGDSRVKFDAIQCGDTSVLARQVKDTLEPYTTSQGTSIERISSGVLSKDAMFAAAQSENTFIMWLLRAAGFVIMLLGVNLLFRPLKVLADVLPLAGRIVGAGTGFIALLISAVVSLSTIALAWLWYRPVLGIGLLVLAAGGLYLLIKAFKRKTA